MKNLQPAMKDKTRYLKFEIHSEEKIELSEVVEAFWDNSIKYLGANNLSEAQPWLIANKFDEENQEGVIQVKKSFMTDLRAALTLINQLNGKKAFFSVKKISGNISNL